MTNINDKIESFELDTDQGKFYSKDHDGKTIEDTKIYEDFHKYYNKAMQLR